MSDPELDSAKVEEFQGKMLGALNGAALALMTSIGHRAGLFDVMSRMRPAKSAEIAAKAGLDERYVREWLAAMVTGGVIEYQARGATYSLPREHASLLTRAARPDNLAATCQWIPVLGSVEDRILECFERGGGVPSSVYARFHDSVADECDETLAASLLDSIVALAPGLRESLERGIAVLDVRCGSGRALNRLAAAFPRSRFTGYDTHGARVEVARAEARARGLGNARFALGDPATMNHSSEFNLVTAFDTIHDQAHPDAVLRAIGKALRPEGVLLMRDVAGTSHVDEDVANPLAPFLYTISCLHCMTVSLADGGMGLGAMWGQERALEMLGDAGFNRVEARQLPPDTVMLYFIARK
jgi:SAM-dependent methyltransferase